MKVKVVFQKPNSGRISVRYGKLVSSAEFRNAACVEPEITQIQLAEGSRSTIVSVGEAAFFLRDVNSEYPIFEPQFGVAVLPANDPRDYDAVALAVGSRGLLSDFQRWEREPEESFDSAAKVTRNRIAPTWLGLGPDIRGFWLDYNDTRTPKVKELSGLDFHTWGYIRPAQLFFGTRPGDAKEPYLFSFQLGPGCHCAPNIERRLEDGVLPILHSIQHDGTIDYDLTAFVTLERHPISEAAVRGTDIDTAYAFGGYCGQVRLPMEEMMRRRCAINRDEETVLMLRVRARNVSDSPAYAFFVGAAPVRINWADNVRGTQAIPSHVENGMTLLEEYGNGAAVFQRINGKPLNENEISILVKPGKEAVFDMVIPNAPLSPERAGALADLDYEEHYLACRNYWRGKLAAAAQIELPEKGIEERVKAGLLHLLLSTSGEQTGPLLAHVGLQYTPIGSESAPMILCYDWLGLPDIAARCIDYFFLHRQQENGFIRTYSNYENETGPALWTAAEHFFITRDTVWLKSRLPQLKRSCDYLLKWRRDNMTEACRAAGCYGLQKGKVDDPDDFFHSFYLNAGSYGGLHGVGLACAEIDPDYSALLLREAEAFRQDIVNAMHIARAKSPAIPVSGGTWVQHLPPWTDTTGDPAYHADGGVWNDHGTILYRVLCNPPIYTGFFGVVDCCSEEMDSMLISNQTPHTINNAAHCQPYYLRNDYAHAMRGEVRSFLKTFYNQLSAMQDRETYTFFEHYYSNPNKAHEEAWFLMQLRWMLFLEDGDTLNFLKCVPRNWMKPGKRIVLQNVRSRFGVLSFRAESDDAALRFEYDVERAPASVRVRLPHPDAKKATRCEGGSYDAKTETASTTGTRGKITLFF